MRDRVPIVLGLVLFLGVVTFPAWYGLAGGVTSKGPEPQLPKLMKQCVAPAAYMKPYHMDLLMNWREEVVRNGARTYHALDGKNYEMSLTRTCLQQCHTNKAEFCDRCHNYVGVQGPYCMNCHVDPKLAAVRRAG